MLEYVDADQPVWHWSARDLAEDSPEDAHRFTERTRAVVFHSGDGDGAAVIGEPAQLIAALERIIADLRRLPTVIDGATVTPIPAIEGAA